MDDVERVSKIHVISKQPHLTFIGEGKMQSFATEELNKKFCCISANFLINAFGVLVFIDLMGGQKSLFSRILIK